MKIRTQFYLLLSGIIIIPLMVIGAMFLMEYFRSPARMFVPSSRDMQNYGETDGSNADDRERQMEHIRRFVARFPESVQIAIVGDNSLVLYSDIEGIVSGEMLQDEKLLNLLHDGNNRHIYQIDHNFRIFSNDEPKESRSVMVISRIMHDFRDKPNRFAELFRTISIILAILLVFCAAVIAAIARSVTRSVSLLDAATRKIADGNFDATVDVRGSNEITSLTKSLNSMRLALKDAQMRRSRFIMGISHDLRTPLALVKGYAEALADGTADSPELQAKSLEIIGSKIDQLDDMIDDIINFVKLDTGELRVSLAHIPIEPLLHEYARRLAADGALLNRRIESFIEIPSGLVIPLDERLFTRMLENLASNALRYTETDGSVCFAACLAPEGGIEITVSDNGCGIAEKDLPYIFDPFFRGTASRREEGKGLGLAVVKNIIDSFGWSIRVQSAVMAGSVFTILIPASQISHEVRH